MWYPEGNDLCAMRVKIGQDKKEKGGVFYCFVLFFSSRQKGTTVTDCKNRKSLSEENSQCFEHKFFMKRDLNVIFWEIQDGRGVSGSYTNLLPRPNWNYN